MFGKTSQLEREIKTLKQSVEKLERISTCREGHHIWEVAYEEAENQPVGSWWTVRDGSKPYMRCEHCFVRKEPEPKKK